MALAQNAPPVVNGSTTSDYEAVVSLIACGNSCFSFCSGTYVQDKWVVTAAHCVSPVQSYANSGYTVWVGVGPRLGELTEYDEIIDWAKHPDYNSSTLHHDIGVLELQDGLSVPPIPVNQDPVTNGWVGTELHYVGWGVTGDYSSDGGIKRYAEMPISSVGSQFVYTADTGDGQNICYGDSGGAALIPDGNGYRLVAANSHVYGIQSGSTLCIGGGSGATRTDSHMDFLRQHFDPDLDGGNTQPEDEPEEEPEDDNGGDDNTGGGDDEGSDDNSGGDINDPSEPFVAWAVPIVVPQGGDARSRIFTDPEGPADLMIIEPPLYGQAEIGDDGWVHFTANTEHQGGDWMAVLVTRGDWEEVVQIDIEIADRNFAEMGCTSSALPRAGFLGLFGLLALRRRR